MTDETDETPEVLDVSNPAQVSKREKARRRADRRANRDLWTVLQSVEGRRVIWRLLERGGMFQVSFSPDPYRTAFNEGRRNGALELVAEVNRADVTAYARMMAEAEAAKETPDV